MADLELTRRSRDRRLYLLDGVGSLHVAAFPSRAATAEAGGKRWRLARRRLWQRGLDATDETGVVVGTFEPRAVRRGGIVRWAGRELTLRPASSWRERYALAAGDRELATFEGKGWGRRPVGMSVGDLEDVEPGLLLSAAFVVRGLAEAGAASAAAASTAATSGG